MTGSRVEIVEVAKTFKVSTRNPDGHLIALDSVTLDVPASSFTAIVGPSGCGKSTLLRVIAGLIRPDRGSVLIDGQTVFRPSEKVGVVFQHIGLFPWRTVLDNVAFGLEIRGVNERERYAIAKRYIKMVGLEGFENYYPHQLSGGMQQRVGLARALALNPSVLLMDEPFGALDAITRRLLQEELLKLWEIDRKTVIFVTHDLDEAVYLADEVVVLTKRPGRVKARIVVDIDRPRDLSSPNSQSKYERLRNQLWSLIKEEVVGTGLTQTTTSISRGFPE